MDYTITRHILNNTDGQIVYSWHAYHYGKSVSEKQQIKYSYKT